MALISKKELGIKIKEARKLKTEKTNEKYNGENLAEDVGISRSYLGDFESGRKYPSYDLLTKIAQACDVPIEFFGDTDYLLGELIEKNFPYMSAQEQTELGLYIKGSIDTPYGIIDLDINKLKKDYDNYKKDSMTIEEANKVINEYHQREIKEKNLLNELEFKTPQDAMKFIIEQPIIAGFGGFEPEKMTDQEVMDFANDLLSQLKLLGYKYKK